MYASRSSKDEEDPETSIQIQIEWADMRGKEKKNQQNWTDNNAMVHEHEQAMLTLYMQFGTGQKK